MNDAPDKNKNLKEEELKKIKDLIIAQHHDSRNISCPIVRTGNKKANNMLQK